jgi:probable HAF family extracellular repeat protein
MNFRQQYKERFMTKQTLKNFALALGLLGVALIPCTSLAQAGLASKFPGSRPAVAAARAAGHQAQSSGSPDISLTFGMVDFPGQTDSGASAANDKGEIVGGYGPNMVGNLVTNHGFLLKGTKFTEIDYPGAAYTEPNGMNDSGVIVGQYGASFSDEQGFKLVGKTYTTIDYPGASLTSANAINKSGEVVGYQYSGGTAHGFLFSKGVFTSIDVPGAVGADAYGINNSGEIVGVYYNSDGSSHGFLLQDGTFTTLDYPGGYSQNYVAGINDQGLIVGGYGEPTTINGVSYVWEHTYVYQNGQFTNADVPFGPPAATQAFGISSNGVIVGEYIDDSDTVYGYEETVGP